MVDQARRSLRLRLATGVTLALKDQPARIGRDEHSDLVLSGPFVGRDHAVVWFGDEGWEVEDQDSANGTWVNGRRVHRSRILPGDVLHLGGNEVRVLGGCAVPNVAGAAVGGERERIYERVRHLLFRESRRPTELTVGDEWLVRNGPFEIVVDGGSAETQLPAALGALRGAHRDLKRKFGYEPRHVLVEIFPRRERFHDAEAQRGRRHRLSTAGICDGAIRVTTDNRVVADPAFLQVLLVHEYAHLAIRDQTQLLCPAWLDEGLALLLSQQVPDNHRRALAQAVRRGKLLPLEGLVQGFDSVPVQEVGVLARAQSRAAAEFIVSRMGWAGIRSLLGAFCDDEGRDTTIGRFFGSYEELDSELARWLSQNRPSRDSGVAQR